MKRLSCLVVISLLSSFAAFGQSDRGTLTGTVSDTAGAVVAAAPVSVTNAATGVALKTVTTSTGSYTVNSIPVGTYTVIVQVPGFKTFQQSGVRVDVAQTARIDVTLEVGAVTDSVSIDADASLLKTESAEQSDTLSGDRINALPLNFGIGGGAIRNPLSFVELAPGTSLNGWNDIKVNGAPNNTFRIIFEGQDTTSDLNPRVSPMSRSPPWNRFRSSRFRRAISRRNSAR